MGNLEDLLGAIVPILFVIFWVISQVMGGINKARKQPPQKLPGEDAQEVPADELAREIERFLGKTRPTPEEPNQSQESTPEPSRPIVTADVVRPPQTTSTRESQPRDSQPRESQRRPKKTRRPPKRKRTKISARGDGSVGVGSVSAPPTQKGAVDLDEKSIVHLPTDSEELKTLTANPATLRQAFLLSQIFSRPEDRW